MKFSSQSNASSSIVPDSGLLQGDLQPLLASAGFCCLCPVVQGCGRAMWPLIQQVKGLGVLGNQGTTASPVLQGSPEYSDMVYQFRLSFPSGEGSR